MTRTPREAVELLNAAINAHDPGSGRDLFAPEPKLVTAGGRTLDLPALGQLLRDSTQAFPDLKVDVTRWIVSGDTVVTEEVMEGTHRGRFAGLAPSGRRIRLPMVHITRVVDGRIVERVAYHDTAGILRQIAEESAT